MFSHAKIFLCRILPKNAFARGVSILVGGTASAQIMLVLAAPLLTRLYTPEDFGLLAVYASMVALIGVISSLRYELAIPLPEYDDEAANVAVLSLLLVFITTFLTAVLVLMLGRPIARLLSVPTLANYLWLLPVGVLLSGVHRVFYYWSVRTKSFSMIAHTKLTQAFVALAIQLAAFKLGWVSLLIGQVAGQSVGTGRLARPALAMSAFQRVSWDGVKTVAVRYQRFPIFSTWAGLVNSTGHQLPPIMLATFFSAGAAGFYALAHRILMLPSNLISSAIGNVLLAHAAQARREKKLADVCKKMQDKLIQIGLPPAIFLMLVGPDLFSFVFGEAWRTAGHFSQFLAAGVFLGFVVSPLSVVFSVVEKQSIGLALQINLLVLRAVGIVIGVWCGELFLAIALYSLASVLGYLFYVVAISTILKISIRYFGKSLIIGLGYSLFALSPVIISLFFSATGADLIFLLSMAMSFSAVVVRYYIVVQQNI